MACIGKLTGLLHVAFVTTKVGTRGIVDGSHEPTTLRSLKTENLGKKKHNAVALGLKEEVSFSSI